MSAATSRVRIASSAVVLAAAVVFSVVQVLATDVAPTVQRALEAQEALVLRDPTPEALNDLGNLLVLAGRETEAESAYRRALERSPNLVAAQYNLGLLLLQRGDAAAADAFRSVLAVEPRNAWAHYQLGVDLENRGERKAAVEHYARAFAYDPALTFAENNPQIIESRLVTQAMIRAQRYTKIPGAQAPRRYGEAGRIVELMLAPHDDEAGAEEAVADGDDPALERDQGAALRGGRSSATDGDDVATEEAEPSPRVLSADDLEDSHVGQVGSGAGYSGSSRRSARDVIERYRRSSGTAVDRSGAEAGGERGRLPSNRIPGSTGGSAAQQGGRQSLNAPPARFVPTRRSSASLDLELRPAAPASAAPASAASASAAPASAAPASAAGVTR